MERLLPCLSILGLLFAAPLALAKVGVSGSVEQPELTPQTANATAAATASRVKMLLKLGALKTEPEHVRLAGALESASRQGLRELPGVRMLDGCEDLDAAVAKRRPPVVLITGKLAELGQKRDGKEVLLSARVEYFVHRMPGQSIAAIVSGAASARVASKQILVRQEREQLERGVVAAAVESAVKRAPAALNKAAE